MRNRHSRQRLDARLPSDSIGEISADCPDDIRAIIIEFTKNGASTNSADYNSINGELFQMGKGIAQGSGKEARCKNAMVDNLRIPEPPKFRSYGDFTGKIPQGETIGGEVKSRFIKKDCR